MEAYIIIMIVTFVFVIRIIILASKVRKKKLEQLQRYWDVEIDMPEKRMLEIMGGGYSRSLLKNNRVKYEWRINSSSVGSSYKGISTRSYSGVKKVTIYTKNGLVEEVKSYNV